MLKLKDMNRFFNDMKQLYWSKDISFFVVDNNLDILIDIDNLGINDSLKHSISNYHDHFFTNLQYKNDFKHEFIKINDDYHYIYNPIRVNDELMGGVFLVAENNDFLNKPNVNFNAYIDKVYTIAKMIENEFLSFIKYNNILVKTKYFSKALHFVHIGLILIDIKKNVIYINDIMEEKLSETKDTINMTPLEDLFPGIDITPFFRGQQYRLYKKVPCKKNNKLYDLTLFSIEKYLEIESIGILVEEAHSPQDLDGDFQYSPIRFQDIIGEDPNFVRIRDFARQIAARDADVLILGESGTGKEIFARAIHNSSSRRKGPFIALNCSAIPNELLESELFGYKGGAFTGASKGGKPGKFELANGGIIFLDEIGDMSYYLQSKMLRVVQERAFERVGGTNTISVDVRIIAATNKNLKKMVNEGSFREDLYYRLNVIPLLLPPLRSRKDDIKILIDYYMDKYSEIYSVDIKGFEGDGLELLLNYDWPGNVRELENTIQFLCCVSNGYIDEGLIKRRIRFINKMDNHAGEESSGIQPLKELEATEIKKALDLYGNSVEGKEQAAKALGIGFSTFYKKLKDYDIK